MCILTNFFFLKYYFETFIILWGTNKQKLEECLIKINGTQNFYKNGA